MSSAAAGRRPRLVAVGPPATSSAVAHHPDEQHPDDQHPDEHRDEQHADGQALADRRLGEGFAAGDPGSLDEAFRRWSPLVHTLALRELRRTADAEDVTQQVFVSAWRSRADYAPDRGSLAGWLVGITRHRLLDHHRRQQHQQRLASTLEAEAALTAVPPRLDGDLERLVLAAEIQQLPDPRGTILRMAFWQGFTHQQIADELGLPLGTVKSHARRALLHLRDRLRETASWPT